MEKKKKMEEKVYIIRIDNTHSMLMIPGEGLWSFTQSKLYDKPPKNSEGNDKDGWREEFRTYTEDVLLTASEHFSNRELIVCL